MGSQICEVKRVAPAPGPALPAYASNGSAGFDLCAALDGSILIHAGGSCLIPTGFAVALPPGTSLDIQPRSGLALKHSITVLNSPGLVDEDYRGEIKVLLINHGSEPFRVRGGDRIAQAVVRPYVRVEIVEVLELSATARGQGGFGSTGV
jgi:dUTP pyrophosphatase